MNPPSPLSIRAIDFVAPTQASVESAHKLGLAVAVRLMSQDRVRISFKGLRGISSGFFNSLFQSVVQQVDPTVVRQRLEFEFDSSAQQKIMERSLRSVLGDAE